MVHIPLLEAHTKDAPDQGPTVVLLGDSMIERMTTTGGSPNFPAPWPSSAMISDEKLSALGLRRLDRVFNAGVAGDKIENLAYRLAGAPHPEDPEKDLPGLLPILARCGTVRVWVVHIGSNDLTPEGGLASEDAYDDASPV
ncbi:hypothetical protein C8A03DRAFT_32520 [Achaetomium macrosporum]|uniref:SGNH hydrolase-type esterase domain-containing protein n=1 Tax=Achaetomium macrosporum TaxID=79813 RepID=A0AAN7HEX5_9PEZI|nr:hypothetical protein C8A03DRAFT_32520 [Achaetomium macrosporum]